MFVQTLGLILASFLIIKQFGLCLSLNNEHDHLDERTNGRNIAPSGAFPFQISLRSNANVHFCGGVLISERWVLSAASCVATKFADEILIVVGAESIRDGTIYTCENVTSHEEFDVSTRQNNIAVLKTSRDVLNSTYVRPTFYYRGAVRCNYPCATSGWGDIEIEGAQYLKYFNVTTLTNVECEAMFVKFISSQEVPINPQNVCVLETSSDDSSNCNGDEGAPLFSSGSMVSIGILSYSTCTEKLPVVFTMTGSYQAWIFAQTMVPGSSQC